MYLSLANLHVRSTQLSPRWACEANSLPSRAQLDVLATNLNQQLELHVGRFQVRREHPLSNPLHHYYLVTRKLMP